MKTTLTHISRISSRLMGSTGSRKIPIPSPKALLLALILGPAVTRQPILPVASVVFAAFAPCLTVDVKLYGCDNL